MGGRRPAEAMRDARAGRGEYLHCPVYGERTAALASIQAGAHIATPRGPRPSAIQPRESITLRTLRDLTYR